MPPTLATPLPAAAHLPPYDSPLKLIPPILSKEVPAHPRGKQWEGPVPLIRPPPGARAPRYNPGPRHPQLHAGLPLKRTTQPFADLLLAPRSTLVEPIDTSSLCRLCNSPLSSNHQADWGRLAHVNEQLGSESGHPNSWILTLDMQGVS